MSQASPLKLVIDRFASGGLLSGVRLLAGLVRIKALATVLGPAGVGLVAQANQLYLILIALGSLSMAVGIIQRIQVKDDLARRRVLSTALGIQFLMSALVAVSAIVSWPWISRAVFDGHLGFATFAILLLSFPWSVLASGYFEGLLFGYHRTDLYVKCSALSAIVELAVTLTLVLGLGLGVQGVVIAIGSGAAVLAIAFGFALLKVDRGGTPLFAVSPSLWSATEARELLRFSMTVLSTSGIGALALLWIRSRYTARFGIDGNGIIQVPVALSAYLLPFVTNGVWNHMHPSISKLKAEGDSGDRIRSELRQTLELSLMLFTALAGLLIAFAPVLVRLIYTREFDRSLEYLPLMMLGDCFYVLGLVIGVSYLARGSLRAYFVGWLAYYAGFLVFQELYFERWSEKSFVIAHLSSSIALGVLSLLTVWTGDPLKRFPLTRSVGVSFLLLIGVAALALAQTPWMMQAIASALGPLAFGIWWKRRLNSNQRESR